MENYATTDSFVEFWQSFIVYLYFSNMLLKFDLKSAEHLHININIGSFQASKS